jgi:hypothetical protein
MVSVSATEDRLIIRQWIFIVMVMYYGILGILTYRLIQEPNKILGFILVATLLMGWICGRPFQLTFTYDRTKHRLIRENSILGLLSTFRDEAGAPTNWVIEVEYSKGEGPNYDVHILLNKNRRFFLSYRKKDADILASYVSKWQDAEVIFYKSKLFGGRNRTGSRLYRKKESSLAPDPSGDSLR